ncbi:hypothetical protein Tco_0161872 [Tanacetum coccineum]
MCLVRACCIRLDARAMAEELSQKTLTGVVIGICRSCSKELSQVISHEHSTNALYSASIEDLETTACFLDCHEIRPCPRNIPKPVIDLLDSGQGRGGGRMGRESDESYETPYNADKSEDRIGIGRVYIAEDLPERWVWDWLDRRFGSTRAEEREERYNARVRQMRADLDGNESERRREGREREYERARDQAREMRSGAESEVRDERAGRGERSMRVEVRGLCSWRDRETNERKRRRYMLRRERVE